MIRVLVETRTVYRSEAGRRARLKRRTAYLDAAWQAWRAKYPCACEEETQFVCGEHNYRMDYDGEKVDERSAYRRKVVNRLARWLMWRDAFLRVRQVRDSLEGAK